LRRHWCTEVEMSCVFFFPFKTCDERLTTNQKAVGSNPAGRTREDPLISITYSVFRLSILVP